MTCTGLASGYTPGIDPNGWRYGETGEQLFMGFAAPRGVVTGTAAYDGVVTELAGAGFVSKNRTNLQAHLQASTAYHCKFFSRDTTLQLIMLLPPGHVTKGNRALISGCIMHEGKLLHCTLDGDSYAYSDDAAEKDPVTGYHQPTKLYYHWEGGLSWLGLELDLVLAYTFPRSTPPRATRAPCPPRYARFSHADWCRPMSCMYTYVYTSSGQTIEEPPRKISCSLEIVRQLRHRFWTFPHISQLFTTPPAPCCIDGTLLTHAYWGLIGACAPRPINALTLYTIYHSHTVASCTHSLAQHTHTHSLSISISLSHTHTLTHTHTYAHAPVRTHAYAHAHARTHPQATDSTPMIVMDVLDHLPWILRKIVQAFFARPFLYLYYKENVAATLRIGDTELITTGKCLFEKHFINPQS